MKSEEWRYARPTPRDFNNLVIMINDTKDKLIKLSGEIKALKEEKVKGKTSAPPLGIIPKEIHDIYVQRDRFFNLHRAISRYLTEGLKINIKWIEEYNELVDSIDEYNRSIRRRNEINNR